MLVPQSPDEPETSSKPRSIQPVTWKSSTHPMSRLAPPFNPVDQSLVLEESRKMLSAVARGKLEFIAQQIRHLQEEAKKIIMEAEINMQLHHASCSFQKRPGHTYHLYLRGPLQTDTYFSLVSPEEWGNPPHHFLGSYKLNEDLTWSFVDEKSAE